MGRRKRPLQTAGILQLPKEIWSQIIDYFVVRRSRSADPFPDFDRDSWEARQNQRVLLALSLTCTSLQDISQEALFRYAVYVPSLKSSKDEQLYRAIQSARPSLQAAVQAITFNLSIDTDYHSALSRLPNLTHLDIVRTWDKPASTHLQLPTLRAGSHKLSHVRFHCLRDDWYEDLARLRLPSSFQGHLTLHNLDLCSEFVTQAPEQCMFPNFSSLCLSISTDEADSEDVSAARRGLEQIIGTAPAQNMAAFSILNSTIYLESYLDPLVHAFGDGLQELTYASATVGNGNGNWDIGRFRQLRKLVLGGDSLTMIRRTPRMPLFVSDMISEAQRYADQLVDRIPHSVEVFQVEEPCLDIFHVVLDYILPRLHNLRRLHILAGNSFRPFQGVVNDLYRQQRGVHGLSYGVVWKPRYKLKEIIRAAGDVDRACTELCIETRPNCFEKALQEELVLPDPRSHRPR